MAAGRQTTSEVSLEGVTGEIMDSDVQGRVRGSAQARDSVDFWADIWS